MSRRSIFVCGPCGQTGKRKTCKVSSDCWGEVCMDCWSNSRCCGKKKSSNDADMDVVNPTSVDNIVPNVTDIDDGEKKSSSSSLAANQSDDAVMDVEFVNEVTEVPLVTSLTEVETSIQVDIAQRDHHDIVDNELVATAVNGNLAVTDIDDEGEKKSSSSSLAANESEDTVMDVKFVNEVTEVPLVTSLTEVETSIQVDIAQRDHHDIADNELVATAVNGNLTVIDVDDEGEKSIQVDILQLDHVAAKDVDDEGSNLGTEDGSKKFESHLDNTQNRSSSFQRIANKMKEVHGDPQTKVLKSEAKVAENPLWDGFTWHFLIQTEVGERKMHICFADIYSQKLLPDGSTVITLFGGITLHSKSHRIIAHIFEMKCSSLLDVQVNNSLQLSLNELFVYEGVVAPNIFKHKDAKNAVNECILEYFEDFSETSMKTLLSDVKFSLDLDKRSCNKELRHSPRIANLSNVKELHRQSEKNTSLSSKVTSNQKSTASTSKPKQTKKRDQIPMIPPSIIPGLPLTNQNRSTFKLSKANESQSLNEAINISVAPLIDNKLSTLRTDFQRMITNHSAILSNYTVQPAAGTQSAAQLNALNDVVVAQLNLQYSIEALNEKKEQASFENKRRQAMATHQDEIDRDERQKIAHAAQAKRDLEVRRGNIDLYSYEARIKFEALEQTERLNLDIQRANAEMLEKAKMADHKRKLEEMGEISSNQLRLMQQTSNSNNSAGIINKSSVEMQEYTDN